MLKAREIIANPRSDFKELAVLLETDQAIAAKVLKLANSAYYGLSGKVSSIQQASVVLGHKALGELITMGGAASILGGILVRYHHYPSRSQGNELAYIVHTADAIAMVTGLGLGIDGMLYKMDDKAMEFLHFEEENVNDIMRQVLEPVQKISEQMHKN